MKETDKIDNNNAGQFPEGDKMVITVKGVKKPEQVLANAKEIMKAVSQFAYTNKWPDDKKWETILPEWFVKSMTDKTIDEIMATKGQWHFGSWVESMYNRAWEWHSSKIDGSTITVVLHMLNIPYIFEQLLYVFYAQGVPMGNITTKDDIYDN